MVDPITSPGPTPIPPPPAGYSAPPAAAVSYDSLSFLAKLAGLILLFVGALLIVVLVTPPSSCVPLTGSCATTYLQNAYNALLAGRILLVLGLGGLAVGASLKLRYSLRWGEPGSPDDVRRWISGRQANSAMLLVSVGLLIFLVFSSTGNIVAIP